MVRSMTGFGRSDVSDENYRVTCEIRAVNHRFFDLYLRVSRRYALLEEPIRERLARDITRGRIEMSLNIERIGESGRKLKIDKELAIAYHDSLIELAKNLGISADFTVMDLVKLPEVLTLEDEEEDMEMVWAAVSAAVDQALEGLIRMREAEGQNLREDILGRNNVISGLVRTMEERSEVVPREYAEKIRKRLQELVPEVVMEETRIAQEIAVFADKASIAEEIVRLNSHTEQLAELLAVGGVIGRKGDFLVQEMFREINTIGSKANDVTISRLVVESKAELEKIREQLQNME